MEKHLFKKHYLFFFFLHLPKSLLKLALKIENCQNLKLLVKINMICAQSSFMTRVTRLGEISPFGRFYAEIFSRKKLPNDLGKILVMKKSPKIYLKRQKFCSKRVFLHVSKIFKKLSLLLYVKKL